MSDAASRIFTSMAGAGKDTVSELSYGVVTSTSPLVITRESGESRTPLSAGFLVLAKTCKKLDIVIDGTPVQIWPDLAIGETVILLSYNAGQKFFVERI